MVRRTFAPWWRVLRPIDLVRRDRPIRRRPTAVSREQPPAKPMPWWRETFTELIALPVVVLLVVVFLAGAPLELAAAGVAGGVLYVLRSLRLVSHRIDVLGLEGSAVRSLSVVLVKGSGRDADAMVARLRTRLAESDTLDLGVPVHSHEGYWD